MNLLDKLEFLMKEKGIKNLNVLSDLSGIPYTTLKGFYTKGTDNIKLSTLEKIKNYFDVALDYLLDDEITDPEYGKTIDFAVTLAEQNHIKKYRTLDERSKKVIDYILSHEYDRINAMVNYKIINSSNERRQLPVHDLPVSAGTGMFLDSDNYEMVAVESSVPLDANFGVRISGDSMEPQIHDGAIVWVKQQQSLEDGQIGIFILNSEGFCKEYRISGNDCRLVSLNKKYNDIVIQEYDECRIFGKVLYVQN